jgi:hypothetical protein
MGTCAWQQVYPTCPSCLPLLEQLLLESICCACTLLEVLRLAAQPRVQMESRGQPCMRELVGRVQTRGEQSSQAIGVYSCAVVFGEL